MGGTIRLQRGGVYSQSLTISKDSTTLADYGDPSKSLPRLKGSIVVDKRSNISIINIDVDGTGKSSRGVALYNVHAIKITNCKIHNFGNSGITCETYGSSNYNSDIQVRGCTISDNFPSGSGHCQGIFISYTNNFLLADSLILNNGWLPKTATIYNHGVYFLGLNGPPIISNCVFINNSSHGLQMRAGGSCEGCIFIDNPIGLSYGLVNHALCHPGGVTGDVKNCVFIGGRDIAGSKRGWCLEASNTKLATISDCLIEGDTQLITQAISVQACQGVENPNALLPESQANLRFGPMYVWNWLKGPFKSSWDTPRTIPGLPIWSSVGLTPEGKKFIGLRPPNAISLRSALGPDYLSRFKNNPSIAAFTGITACRVGAGVP